MCRREAVLVPALAVVASLFQGCGANNAGPAASTATTTTTGGGPAAFLVMGDWGGDEHRPYTTPSEKDTAGFMSTEAEKIGAKFALALGDNFYHSGVTSVHDRRFQETFESVFTGHALSVENGFKFHVVAGNHDHVGSVQAQIDYSSLSKRWFFPSLYYTFTETSPDGATMQFVMLDTVTIAGQSQLEGGGQLLGSQLKGAANRSLADAQVQWLEQTLGASSADYLLVAGHYPVHSVCEHGPTAALQETVKPLLRKYKVSAYLAGHDHCSEHIDVGDGVQYHGIGSAAYHDQSEAHRHTVLPSQLIFFDGLVGGGFASFLASRSQMVVTHHDGLGNSVHNSTIPPRKLLQVVV